MQFKNPANGHIESKSAPWLWTLLFGGLYFVASGLWAHVVIWSALVLALFWGMGNYAFIFVLLLQLLYAAFAEDIVTNSYLRKGWAKMDGSEDSNQSSSKQCPYCAEDIKREAIKCKHCGSELAA